MVGERGDRPKFKSAGQATSEELAAAAQDFFAANIGTWSVSEGDKTLAQHFDVARRPNNEGTDVKSSVSLAGDELKLINQTVLPTGASIEQVYRRAKYGHFDGTRRLNKVGVVPSNAGAAVVR